MDKKRHHYIPKHYLRGFTQSLASEKIWVYEKGKTKNYRTNLKNAGVEGHYYTISMQNGKKDSNTLENWLADYIEGPASSIIDKIRNLLPITAEEKFTMSVYMYVMSTRVPHHIQRHLGIVEKVCDEIIAETIRGEIPERLLSITNKEGIIQVVTNVKNSSKKNLYLSSIKDKSGEITTAIYTMNWRFLTFKGERDFITSDNPFTFDEWQGLSNPQAQITFPISSNIIILATWLNNNSDLEYFKTDQSTVDLVNWRTYKVSTKYVYYRADEEWVTKRVNSEDLNLQF